MRLAGILLAGLALLLLGGAGVWHGLRTERAQALYFHAKYGRGKGATDQILATAARAWPLYPHNDRLCILAAEAAWYDRFDDQGRERPDRLADAQRWCQAGLTRNPYSSQLQLLDTRLTARHSLPEAIRKWEAYVDWQYWEPYNHVVLVDLYARAGRYPEAKRSLALLESQPRYHAEALQALATALRDEVMGLRALQEQQQRGLP